MIELINLLNQGLSPAEAIDYYFVEMESWKQTDWALMRCVNQQSVSQNVRQAKQKLGVA